MTRAATGLLVTFDGPGGAGKTITVRHLTDLLTRRGHRVHATTQPSSSELGQIARHRNDTYRGHALACLVAADRYHHLATEIRPHKAASRIVVCDRYVAASYVLQRIDGVPVEFISAINANADVPDLAVILTVEPAVAAGRIDSRGTSHRFETGIESSAREAEFYADAIRQLTTLGYPLVTIDTTYLRPEQVAKRIASRIADLTARPIVHAPTA